MGDGKVLYSEANGRLFIRMVGEIRYTISPGFQALLRKYLAEDSSIEEVLVDLNEARYLDSTNLGLLAQIARYMIKRFNRKPTVLCANKEIYLLLDTMGFNDVFTIVQSTADKPPELQEVGKAQQDSKAKARMMLDAHRALVEMNARNAVVFKNVIELFEKELSGD